MIKRMPNPFPGVNPTNPNQIVPKVVKPAPKAGRNGTLISVILDESGSMKTNQLSTIDAFNEFHDSQRLVEGECSLTLTKFSTPLGQERITVLYDALPIHNVPNLTTDSYSPNGNTPLLDAVGQSIEAIDKYLETLSEENRPSVLMTIMTDGLENCSKRFTNSQIKEMIKAREEKDWMITFLGANVDAFAEGAKLGLQYANTMAYNTSNMGGTMKAMSASTTRYRSARAAGVSNADIMKQGLFSDEDRQNSI